LSFWARVSAVSGFPAWLAWLGVHLIFLIGFRNKLAVLLQWAYAYTALNLAGGCV
jgi:NADH dehydrogenase FAD-containing subunit